MNGLFKTTADQLRYALSQEWCNLYGNKKEWNDDADNAENEASTALLQANEADAGDVLTDKEVDDLYSIAEALEKEARAKRERADCLEMAMELIEKLETLYSEDWKEA